MGLLKYNKEIILAPTSVARKYILNQSKLQYKALSPNLMSYLKITTKLTIEELYYNLQKIKHLALPLITQTPLLLALIRYARSTDKE